MEPVVTINLLIPAITCHPGALLPLQLLLLPLLLQFLLLFLLFLLPLLLLHLCYLLGNCGRRRTATGGRCQGEKPRGVYYLNLNYNINHVSVFETKKNTPSRGVAGVLKTCENS